MDDLNLDLDTIEESAEGKLKVKNRFEKLSETAITATKAKEESEAKLKTEAEARVNAEKERDFFKDFSNNSQKYPNANAHQDKIWEKVRGGYSTEDAIVAVLAKEGQLGVTERPITQTPEVAGGSSQTPIVDGGNKELRDMSTEEKLNALRELEKRGDISLS